MKHKMSGLDLKCLVVLTLSGKVECCCEGGSTISLGSLSTSIAIGGCSDGGVSGSGVGRSTEGVALVGLDLGVTKVSSSRAC